MWKDGFCEKIECEFNKFPKNKIKMLWNFYAKVGSENIFKLTIGNKRLNENSNDNGVTVISFATF